MAPTIKNLRQLIRAKSKDSWVSGMARTAPLLVLCLLLASCGSLPGGIKATSGPATPVVHASVMPTLIPAATDTATPPATMQVRADDLRGVEVTFWQPMTGDLEDEFTQLADDFNQQNTWGIHVSVKLVGGSGAMTDALPTAVNMPSTLPQVVLATSEQLAGWRKDKTVIGLEDYLHDPTWGLSQKEIAGFLPVFWNQDRNGTGQFGIPALRSAYGLFYNKSWAKELGFNQAPVTTAQFSEQACAAAKVNNQSDAIDKHGTGGWLISTEPLSTLSWLNAFGAKGEPNADGLTYTFDQSEAQKAFAYLYHLQELGCVWDGRSPSPYDYFADRYALFYTGTLQDILPQAGVMKQLGSMDEWTFIPYPGEKGNPAVVGSGFSYGVVQSDIKHQMAGWLFVRWLSQPEQQARLAALYPSLPVSVGAETLLDPKKADFPVNLVLPLDANVQPAPSVSSWRVVRNMVEDATYQLFHLPKKEQLPKLLPQLDEMIKELVQP